MINNNVVLFLKESNAIEREYSFEALSDAKKAWQYAVDEQEDFGIDYVCGIHKKLMWRLNPEISGKLRRKSVCIVGRDSLGETTIIRRIPAKGNKPRLRKWCEKYWSPQNAEEIREAHIDFEMIHPFIDGNGRTGRILYNVQRLQLGLDVEVFYEGEKHEYYKWFTDKQREEDLVKFMLGN